ncbi:hypothetical protein [Apocheima cinerarium nucleopolyhedrovirus]|uniref:hypothetical protein n=1 Tax=Apocheima cinerarium nucleopolyhedrovirus TaxID=307461 RepID=UPI0001D920C6|nr:hypothetical protein [Apocheima cinerarium nucleopolyhedrovirus]ADB84459.1 hypothetical protein [Apocheima cinerarium nucleopolyhedrovirus]
MSSILNKNDIVNVIITNYRIYGIHIVKIEHAPQYRAVLIANNKIGHHVYYENLKLKAKVMRINGCFVDLIPIK